MRRNKKCGAIFMVAIMITLSTTACRSNHNFEDTSKAISGDTKNEQSTIFNSLNVEKDSDSIISKGEVVIHHGMDGVLLTVDVNEDTAGTFSIAYTKDKGTLSIKQNSSEILSLQKDEVSEMIFDDTLVDMKKGINEFIIAGDDCTCEYTATLTVNDLSKIESFGGGSTKPQK